MSLTLVKEKLLNKKNLLVLCLLTAALNNVDVAAMKRTRNTNADANSSDNEQPYKRHEPTTTTTTTTTTTSSPESAASATINDPTLKQDTPTKTDSETHKNIMDCDDNAICKIMVYLALTNDPSDKNVLLAIIKQLCRLTRINKRFYSLLKNDQIVQILQCKEIRFFRQNCGKLGDDAICKALLTVIKSRHPQPAADILIKARADIKEPNFDAGFSAICAACIGSMKPGCATLNGEFKNVVRDLLATKTLFNPAHCNQFLLLAANFGDTDMVNTFSAGVNMHHRDIGISPLYVAAKYGYINTVKLLLEAHADVDGGHDDTNQSPLSIASSKGHSEIVRILLERGADKDLADAYGKTPLWHASRKGKPYIVSILLKWGADINRANDQGKTPLWVASKHGEINVVQLLLQSGADTNRANEQDETPLWVACKHGQFEVVLLLLKFGANKSKANDDGQTTLQVASSAEIATLLSGVPIPYPVGKLMLDSAKYGDIGMVNICISAGVNVNAMVDGFTPLHAAAYQGHIGMVNRLLEVNANVDARTETQGLSPLCIASARGYFEIAKPLLERGADKDLADFDGKTPLWHAAIDANIYVIHLLIQWGADINKANKNGETPLWIASKHKQFEVALLLLECGADKNKAANNGQTPLQVVPDDDSLIIDLLK